MSKVTQMTIGDDSQQKVLRVAKAAITNSNLASFQTDRQTRFSRIDRYYHRQSEKTKEALDAERKSKAGDKTKLREITIGVVKSHVDSAVNYLQETFLSGYPIMPVISEPGEADDEAVMLETIMSEHAYETGWELEFIKNFNDCIRYNESFLEAEWCVRKVPAMNSSKDLQNSNGNKATEIEWEGNILKRWDPYNTFYDPRVTIDRVPREAEYVGTKEIWTKIKLKKFILDAQDSKLPIMNTKAALLSSPSGELGRYFTPEIILEEDDRRGDATTNWADFAGFGAGLKEVLGVDTKSYSNQYEVTTLYMRIIPVEFGINVSAKNTPQIWKFIIVNDQHVIAAIQLDNVHGFIPVFTCQPVDPGLGHQTKSFADGVTTYQDTASALWNIGLSAQRRIAVDRVVYDPSKIDPSQMNSPNAAAKIPLRRAAWGTNPAAAVYQFPFNTSQTNTLFSEAQGIVSFADEINGQNRASRGQFQKGNKSRYEYSDVMSNSNANNRSYAMQYENQCMAMLKKALLFNVLQYASSQQMFNRNLQQQVSVDPVAIRKAAVQFKVADGARPADKIMDGESWNQALQVLMTNQQIGQDYRIGEVFASLMSMRGANLRPFRISQNEKMYSQAMTVWQQQSQLALEKGAEFKTPMPTPQQFGIQLQTQQQPQQTEQQTQGEQQ